MPFILLLVYLLACDHQHQHQQPGVGRQYTTPDNFVFVRDMSREQKLGMMR